MIQEGKIMPVDTIGQVKDLLWVIHWCNPLAVIVVLYRVKLMAKIRCQLEIAHLRVLWCALLILLNIPLSQKNSS